MHSVTDILSAIPLHWWLIFLASALAIGIACVRALESEDARKKRAEHKKRNDLQTLAKKISIYGQAVHQQFPTGRVVVSEHDLAEQLRKRPETVVIALKLLLNEQKVQRAPLSGYWKLNV